MPSFGPQHGDVSDDAPEQASGDLEPDAPKHVLDQGRRGRAGEPPSICDPGDDAENDTGDDTGEPTSSTAQEVISVDEAAERYSERARAARERQGVSPIVDDRETLTSLSELLTTEE